MQIINWSNSNQGFLTAIFSVIALLFSGISVWIAIKALKAPYKKKLILRVKIGTNFLISESGVEPDVPCISVTAVNNGNRTIILNDLCLYCNNIRLVTIKNLSFNRVIAPAEARVVEYQTIKIVDEIGRNPDKLSRKQWYGYASDTEGKTYTVRANKILKPIIN